MDLGIGFSAALICFTGVILSMEFAGAAGLDVQLKDLRNSYYYMLGGKECSKLVFTDTKKFGRLTHCDPEEGHVMCKLKSGEKLFAFEQKELCEASLKKGVDPTPAED